MRLEKLARSHDYGANHYGVVIMKHPNKVAPARNAGRKADFGESVPSRISVPFELAQHDQKQALAGIWQSLQVGGFTLKDLQFFLEQFGIDVIRQTQFENYRMYSTPVAASFGVISGSDADSGGYEEVNVKDLLIGNPDRTILLKVTGNSMTDEGIYPGTILVVETPDTSGKSWLVPNDRDIVVALVDDVDLTVKQFRQLPNGAFLYPRNKEMKGLNPRIIDENVNIIGIVKKMVQDL
jgi:SOS-response transcriptional repressor LexA